MEIKNSRHKKWKFPVDHVLNSLRKILYKFNFIPYFRILRNIIHFGPWRIIPQYLIRVMRPIDTTRDTKHTSLLNKIDIKAVVDEVRLNSVAIAGVLDANFVRRLRLTTDQLPTEEYPFMNYVDEDICRITRDPQIMQVVRTYLQCEPVLLEANLVVCSSHLKNNLNHRNLFHYDYAGWDSLNVFVYLTDVTEKSTYHMIAKGSHQKYSFNDMLCSQLSDEQSEHRFGSTLQKILGPAGTVFFENTEAFHRRKSSDQRRVMLNLLFSSHRNWISHGRFGGKRMEKLAEAYRVLKHPSVETNC